MQIDGETMETVRDFILGAPKSPRLHFHFSLSCIGEGNGNPLQCSCLENPRDEGSWWAAIYGVTQSRTRMKWLSRKITADGDCSHEIKRRLFLGRKAMTNLDSILKSRDSAIKKNAFGSVLMRWMKLKPIIQSEVNQKKKTHQYILMHIYGI